MINTLLFDLDGTLSTMDTNNFTKTYLTALGQRVCDLITTEKFFPHIMASTKVMIANNNPEKTNLEVFMESFSQAVGLDQEILWPEFLDFYTNEFYKFGNLVSPNPINKVLIEEAKQRGYTLAIACNPVMPKPAIIERIKWTQINPSEFEFIPSIENMHFCKPNPNFFAEIIDFLGKKPSECLMIGNEPKEDMIAGEIGIKTYLITEDYNEAVKCDYQGGLTNLLHLIRENKL